MTDLTSGPLPRIDITDPRFKADPFPTYALLRAEAPVHPVPVPMFGTAYLVTRYDDVSAAFRDERLLKNRRTALTPEQFARARRIPAALAPLERNLLALDGGDHDRLRALVRTAFTPRRIQSMREQASLLADQLLDAALAKAERHGRFDLIADYALPLPLTLIARILGVPERDNARFSAWTTNLLALGRGNPLLRVPSVLMFLRYLRRLIAERTTRPADDLVSALAAAREADDALSADEVLSMIVLLLTAGHETTVNLIGTGALALLQHPDQLALLRNTDDRAAVGTAVEELVRYVVPAETATERFAREDLTIAGTPIPRGALVLNVIASANRDPAHFTDPERLDLTRRPNKHLSFGQGAHYCLGASLSRLDAEVALPALLRRVPGLQLAVPVEQLRWRGGLILRGMASLPVRC
ncbi:MAG: cytochrome P450 [Pseudonocardia sp.]|nr:cytochrome P450 [Pseudonocardia sp.]